MDPDKPNSIKENILRKIQAHEVSMRPKFYFSLQVAALVAVALVVLVISVFIFNFIAFSIRINSDDALLWFGPRGIGAFLMFFPWWLLLLDIALVLLLERLVRQFRFGYHIPVLYLFGALVLLTFVFGAVLDRGTRFNDHFLREADRHHLPPPLGEFYRHARHEHFEIQIDEINR